MREPDEEEIKAARETTQPYRKLINDTPALLSLLYDIDLLPEQIRLYVNATRMVAICELFKLVPPESKDNWQSIETAPKDNSAVIVYVPMETIKFMATAFWDTVACEWRIAWTGLDNKPVKIDAPTHWMPLPDRPSPNGEVKQP